MPILNSSYTPESTPKELKAIINKLRGSITQRDRRIVQLLDYNDKKVKLNKCGHPKRERRKPQPPVKDKDKITERKALMKILKRCEYSGQLNGEEIAGFCNAGLNS